MLRKFLRASPGVFLFRWLVSAILIFGAYNPSGKSYYHYMMNVDNPSDAWNVLGAVAICLLLVALFIATYKALGFWGKVIFGILFGAVGYLFVQEGWVDVNSAESMTWFGLGCLSFMGGVGLSGAIVWRRATGQVVTDEADDLRS